jgi:hypothetical protein
MFPEYIHAQALSFCFLQVSRTYFHHDGNPLWHIHVINIREQHYELLQLDYPAMTTLTSSTRLGADPSSPSRATSSSLIPESEDHDVLYFQGEAFALTDGNSMTDPDNKSV